MTNEHDKVVPLDTYLTTLHQAKGGMNRQLENPSIAAELAARLANEPLPDGVIPTTDPAPGTLPPVAYVCHNWTHHCLACNSKHHHSEIFSLHHIASRFHFKRVNHLTPTLALEFNVPLHVYTVPTKTTPFCFECLDAARDFLSTLPTPPVPQAILKPALSPTEEKPKATTPKTKKTPASIDDLMA